MLHPTWKGEWRREGVVEDWSERRKGQKLQEDQSERLERKKEWGRRRRRRRK